MTWFQPIIDRFVRLQVRIAIAMSFARCRMDRGTARAYYAALNLPDGMREHYVGLVVTRPKGTERLRFSGTDKYSPAIAAKKAFSEYLEALTLWDLGATEEESRSGWACGRTEQEAEESAYQELIERDALVTHFLCPELKTWVLPAPAGGKEFRLVRLQSVDPKLVVVLCGYFLENSGRWLIGGACEQREMLAAQKAVLEVVMMRKDWHGAPPEAGMDQPKREAFWPHWESSSDPLVMKNVEAVFSGGGGTVVDFRIDRARLFRKAVRSFSQSDVVVGCGHADIAPLTFGSLWKNSEGQIRNILKRRGLTPEHWLTHPML
jgi:hypothetical protein